ncbi:glycosyltransferase family 2 protein [Salinimicrobium sp. TH3]|uniref:glycosyltransferase family 2 protein n=1 Tax=Salinimicrobium sp. TH3 TaxID=2997342 RepID=UPI0022757341|nr:glycosyltransferase family 2 protein [Salinimicrobium sp. TH3]MCY2687850.1 glycosyltransferase family 2 protein [Salinimicrobium sp. TH3]
MLAIVIPFYKISFFEQTLKSLANQTNKEFRVYIGDDASPDNPVDIISFYEDLINISYQRFEHNLGGKSLTSQWERCIEMVADERWIMILGDDDYVSNNYVQEFYQHLDEIENYDIKVVRFATRVLREPGGELSNLFTHPKIESSTDFFYRKFLKFSRGSLSEQIFRKDAYLKNKFRDFPLGWGADNFAWLDFTEFGSIYTINNATAFFRISELNISRGGYEETLKQQTKWMYFNLIVEQYLHKFKKEQRVPLLLFYEQVVYYSDKISPGFFITMHKNFIREKAYIQVLKFSRRFFLFLINKWNGKHPS